MNYSYYYILLCIVFSCARLSVCAQSDSTNAIELKPAIVIGDRTEFDDIRPNQTIDNKSLEKFSIYNIGDALDKTTFINTNSYGGAGAAAGINIRGMSNNNTAIIWNGFKYNSITLGEGDISMIPNSAAQQVNIVYSGNATQYGSGTLGGAVVMTNEADWNTKYKIGYQLNAGSFKNQRHILNAILGNQKLQYHISLFYQDAANEFTFKDTYKLGEPTESRLHNSLNNRGIVQHLFFRGSKGKSFQIGNWMQQKDKELPANMGSNSPSNQEQKDNVVRTYFKWQQVFKHGNFNWNTAYFQEYLNYTDKANADDINYLIDSKIKIFNVQNIGNYGHYFSDKIKGNVGFEFNNFTANNSNYDNRITEQQGSIFIDLKSSYKSLSFIFNIRQDLDKFQYVRPLFSASSKYAILKDKLILSASFADKYRRPNFNERYWFDGFAKGNLNLNPEYGWGIDVGISGTLSNQNKSQSFSYSNNFYLTKVNDGIVWQPSEGIWSPQNIEKLSSFGIENSIDYSFKFGKYWSLKNNWLYHYNKTIDQQAQLLLPYRPIHTIKSQLDIVHKYFETNINWRYISTRFTDKSNTELFALQPYHLIDIGITTNIIINHMNYELGFQIENLTNTSYEIRRTFAQPGRAYYLNFKINFIKQQK